MNPWHRMVRTSYAELTRGSPLTKELPDLHFRPVSPAQALKIIDAAIDIDRAVSEYKRRQGNPGKPRKLEWIFSNGQNRGRRKQMGRPRSLPSDAVRVFETWRAYEKEQGRPGTLLDFVRDCLPHQDPDSKDLPLPRIKYAKLLSAAKNRTSMQELQQPGLRVLGRTVHRCK